MGCPREPAPGLLGLLSMHTPSRRGFSTLYTVVAIMTLLSIFGFSSWFVNVNLSREVGMAEAGRTIRLACDSGIEEAIEGFIRSVNMSEREIKTDADRAAYNFGQAIRRLVPGKVLRTRFVPENTRKALKPISVDVREVEVSLFCESTMDGSQDDSEARCKRLLAVLEKWSRIPG
jgi:hypothetical protein